MEAEIHTQAISLDSFDENGQLRMSFPFAYKDAVYVDDETGYIYDYSAWCQIVRVRAYDAAGHVTTCNALLYDTVYGQKMYEQSGFKDARYSSENINGLIDSLEPLWNKEEGMTDTRFFITDDMLDENGNLHVRATLDRDANLVVFNDNVYLPQEGSRQVEFTDEATGASATVTFTVVKDTAAPEAPVIAQGGDGKMTLTAAEEDVTLYYSYDGTEWVLYSGPFAPTATPVYAKALDRTGNESAVSQLAVTVFWVPHQVQYFTTFCIAYAGCAWVLARPRRAGQLSIALVVLGTCTAFCDLLVTPIITLGLPVAVWLCCLPQRAASGARQCLPVIGGSLCWGAGYAMCWGLKWVLATLITGQDIIGDAIHQAGVRTTADTWHGMELSWGNIFRFVGDTLSQRGLLWPVVLVVILCIAAFLLCLRNKEALLRALPIGLTALMAPVWLALLRTHSIQHGWFTWRSLTVSIFAGLAFLYYSCRIRTGLRRLRGQKQQG